MRNQEQSIQDTQRKHDYEAYASVFNGIDAFVVRNIALGHGAVVMPWSMSQMPETTPHFPC